MVGGGEPASQLRVLAMTWATETVGFTKQACDGDVPSLHSNVCLCLQPVFAKRFARNTSAEAFKTMIREEAGASTSMEVIGDIVAMIEEMLTERQTQKTPLRRCPENKIVGGTRNFFYQTDKLCHKK